jgi:PPOX class probable F420-dependent enzyme
MVERVKYDDRMRFDLKIEDLSGFLDEAVVATLATYGADGIVRLSPVWCEWLNDGFNVVIPDGDVKARHLRQDGRTSLVVYENEPPYRGVEIRTEAVLGPEGAHEVEARLAHKYLGAGKAESWLANTSWDPLLVRLEPGELRVWDFADDDL